MPSRRSRYAKGIAVAVAAAVLGVTVDRLTKGAFEVGVLTLIVLVIAIIAIFISLEEQVRAVASLRELATSEGLDSRRRLETLQRHVGVKVSLQSVRELNIVENIDGDAVAQAMFGAKRELLIVDLIPENGVRPDHSMRDDLLREQWDRIIKLPRDNPDLSYKRLCQVGTTGTNLVVPQMEATFVEHCREMLTLRAQIGARVSLRLAPLLYPYKFIIVDGDILILELHKFDHERGAQVVDQELIVRDAGGSLIEAFRAMWDDLSDRPETRSAVSDDLR